MAFANRQVCLRLLLLALLVAASSSQVAIPCSAHGSSADLCRLRRLQSPTSPPFLRFPLLPAAHQNSPFPPFLRPPLPVMQGVPGSSVDPCPGANQCPSKAGCFSRGDYCDGVKNCADGSDEWPWICSFDMDCGALNATHVLCPDSPSVCILPGQYCDGKNRLPGRARRKPRLLREFHLPENSLRCPGLSTCKPGGALCNAVPDCPGKLAGSVAVDEDPAFCRGYTCPKGSSKCSDNLQCVDDVLRCNGVKECKDGSDEVGCDKWNCTKGFRKCKDQLQCVSKLNWCNKVADCKDGSDEATCVPLSTPDGTGSGTFGPGSGGSGAGKPGTGGTGSGGSGADLSQAPD
ncbi:unnamed protein product [Closterium sp. NIES-64]|nr:unnamed protein product [Closterium sp. NIES-64]